MFQSISCPVLPRELKLKKTIPHQLLPTRKLALYPSKSHSIGIVDEEVEAGAEQEVEARRNQTR